MDVKRRGERGRGRRERVLFLTCHLPYAGWSGGRRRELELLRRITGTVDVEVCAVTKTPEDDLAELDGFRRDVCPAVVFPAEPCRHDPSLPAQVLRHCSDAATRWLSGRVGDVDLVHVEGSYLWHLLPQAAAADGPPVVVVEQNVESMLWQQRAAVAVTEVDRRRCLDEAERTAAWEDAVWRRATVCAAVTDEDAAVIRAAVRGVPVLVVPDGADLPEPAAEVTPAPKPPDRPVLAYIGNYAYEPNVDAARHLVADVLPLVRAAGHDPAVWLVGNEPGPEVAGLADDPAVTVTGTVPEVGPYLAAADVVVVPLRIGGGVKVKVLEALAAGKAVVTTPVGAQGLAAASRAGALAVGTGARQLAGEVASLLADDGRRLAMERAASAAARRLPTWDDAACHLLDTYAGAVTGSYTGSRRARAAR
jgi:polysaccharide biosynthesis protein PslH